MGNLDRRIRRGRGLIAHRALVPLSAVVMVLAGTLAVAQPADAFIKDIKLTIKTNLPYSAKGAKGDVFVVTWRTECNKNTSTGEQSEVDSSNHTCDESKLKFSCVIHSKYFRELDGESLSAELNNRFIGRPDLDLWFYGSGNHHAFVKKDGYDQGETRKATVKTHDWVWHLKFTRDADLKHYKQFTLTIDLAHG